MDDYDEFDTPDTSKRMLRELEDLNNTMDACRIQLEEQQNTLNEMVEALVQLSDFTRGMNSLLTIGGVGLAIYVVVDQIRTIAF